MVFSTFRASLGLAQHNALRLGPLQARHDALADHAALQLGKHRGHVQHRFAVRYPRRSRAPAG